MLSLREKEFVDAARAAGASDSRIMFREIMPNLLAPLIVYATLLIPINILFEAALSFLGVGVQPPTASWGAMIAERDQHLRCRLVVHGFSRYGVAFHGLGLQSAGDGLQDALSPRAGK